jgi:hypothetical protein
MPVLAFSGGRVRRSIGVCQVFKIGVSPRRALTADFNVPIRLPSLLPWLSRGHVCVDIKPPDGSYALKTPSPRSKQLQSEGSLVPGYRALSSATTTWAEGFALETR